MSQRADTGGTGARNQEETTAFESSTQVKFASEYSKRMFGRHNGGQYCNCKRYSSLTRVPALSSQRSRKSDVTLISLLRKAVRPVHQLKSGKRMTSHQFSTTNADCTDLKKERNGQFQEVKEERTFRWTKSVASSNAASTDGSSKFAVQTDEYQ